MTVVALQGLHGGVGTTSIVAGLAWALKQLGEKVLVIDLCPDNMLRLYFNMPVNLSRGWARAGQDNTPWQQSAMRYTAGLDFLPFGQLSFNELQHWSAVKRNQPEYWLDYLSQLVDSKQYQWILFDMPFSYPFIEQHLLSGVDLHLCLMNPDVNDHIRLHQQILPNNCHLLVNKFSASSELQEDLQLLWLQSVERLLPFSIHLDEAVAEAFAVKKPIGEYLPDSLAANELLTLANWCLIKSGEQS